MQHEELSQEEVAERLDVLRRHVGGGWWMRGMRLGDTAGTPVSTAAADTGFDGRPGEERASSDAVESMALPQQNLQPSALFLKRIKIWIFCHNTIENVQKGLDRKLIQGIDLAQQLQ